MSSDPYLRPGLEPSTDIELYPSQSTAGPITHTVTAEVGASAEVAVTASKIPAAPLAVGAWTTFRTSPAERLAQHHRVAVSTVTLCSARVLVVPVYTGRQLRQRSEDELLLVGVL